MEARCVVGISPLIDSRCCLSLFLKVYSPYCLCGCFVFLEWISHADLEHIHSSKSTTDGQVFSPAFLQDSQNNPPHHS